MTTIKVKFRPSTVDGQPGSIVYVVSHNRKVRQTTSDYRIPLNLGYRFASMFVQAGPTVCYGLYGSKIEWYSGGSDNYFDVAKRFDLGVGGRIGFEFNKLQISAGANYGLLEVFDGGGHNLNINLGFAYMF